jgi:hypothetical protein
MIQAHVHVVLTLLWKVCNISGQCLPCYGRYVTFKDSAYLVIEGM